MKYCDDCLTKFDCSIDGCLKISVRSEQQPNAAGQERERLRRSLENALDGMEPRDESAAPESETPERESKQRTLTARELFMQLAQVVFDGHGNRPVFVMDCDQEDGLTHAVPIHSCMAAEPYDGEIVWIHPRGD